MTTRSDRPAPRPGRPSTTLTARTPEDLLAAVPVLLGFHPERSVVMLALGGAHQFHARADLPPAGRDGDQLEPRRHLEQLVDLLLAPVRRHRVPRVAFVLYTADRRHGEAVARVLRRRFTSAGVAVVSTLRADAGRWWTCPAGSEGVPVHGVPYDVSAHAFAAQAVLDGQVTHGSRDELAATVAADEDGAARVAQSLAGRTVSGSEALLVATSAVRQHVLAGTDPDDLVAATVAAAAADDRWCEQLVRGIDRSNARSHVRFWTSLVRRSPVSVVAGTGAVLAWAAWQAGDGALAWCALDRAGEGGADSPLGAVMAVVLDEAVPPSAASALRGG